MDDIYNEHQKKMINDILFEEKFIIHEPKKGKGFLSIYFLNVLFIDKSSLSTVCGISFLT